MSRYIDTKNVAKLIRRDLKDELPHLRFSVRISRYAGGSSIRVAFKDDQPVYPKSIKIAQDICNRYEGKGFDGMTDCSYYKPIVVDGEECSSGCYIFLENYRGYLV